MVIPFVLATSCIVIAAATQFHAKPFDGLLETANGETRVNQNSAKYADYAKLMDARGATSIQAQPEEAEMRIASMLIQRVRVTWPLPSNRCSKAVMWCPTMCLDLGCLPWLFPPFLSSCSSQAFASAKPWVARMAVGRTGWGP